MDLLRSCYRGLMRFSEDEPAKEVRWFFCSPDAEIFRGPTPFRSANWEATPYTNEGLGEQRPGKRPWVNGVRPTGMEGTDLGCRFPDDWWSNGVPANVRIAIPRTESGVPFCCLPAVGGVAVSGSADVTVRGPYARIGGCLVGGDASVEFRILPGGVEVGGDAEVNPHPPTPIPTLCCPLVPRTLTVTFDVFGVCPEVAALAFPIEWDGAKWTGTSPVFNVTHTITVELECTGAGAFGWEWNLYEDATLIVGGGTVFIGSCGPLHIEGTPAFLLTLAGCTGVFAQLIVDE